MWPSPGITTKVATLGGALVLVLAACGGDSDELQTDAPPTATTPAPATASVAPGESTPAPAPPLPPEQTASVSAPAAGDEIAHLTDIRIARQGDVDRITFEFDGPVPGYEIGYATLPPRQDGSGKTVAVQGDAGLSVRFNQASSVDLTGGYRETYTGADRVSAEGTTSIVESVFVSDYEASLVWAIGVNRTAPFEVSTLTDPSRVFINIG